MIGVHRLLAVFRKVAMHEKHLELYRDEGLVNVDEIDMLGLYYENDLTWTRR